MNSPVKSHCLLQGPWLRLFCLSIAALLAYWGEVPWPTQAGLLALGACLLIPMSRPIAADVAPPRSQTLLAAWVASAAMAAGWMLAPRASFTPDGYHSWMFWALALAVADRARLHPHALKARWRALCWCWTLAGSLSWLAGSYLNNRQGEFYAGFAVLFGVIVLARIWFRPRTLWVVPAHTMLMLLVALPVVDYFLQPKPSINLGSVADPRHYSYTGARRDPAAFAAWWNHYLEQWFRLGEQIYLPATNSPYPVRLKPGARGRFFQSLIAINSDGLRGADIPPQRGRAYRILALGESTTFGCTLAPDDKPWPRVLEQIVRERLALSRPVQVINAGVPSLDIQHNARRLKEELLRFEPDLILSYHGYNGFHLLDAAIPRTHGHAIPPYQARPLKLLADAEYRLRLRLFHRRARSAGKLAFANSTKAGTDPFGSPCATAYRQLAAICADRDIRLVLANFSMAVNRASDRDVVNFYRAGFPSVHRSIAANETHSRLVQQLARESAELIFVDTHPGLDGRHELFIDLVHFTQAGRQRLAEIFFQAIQPVLAEIH